VKHISSSLLLVVLTTLGFASQALCAQDPLLSDVLKGAGHLTFLKSVSIPGSLADGTKVAMRTASYFSDKEILDGVYDPSLPDPEKLSCLADYSTSVLDSSDVALPLIKGLDLNIAAGKTTSWDMSDFDEARYTYEKNQNGFYVEQISLSFYNEEHSLMDISCSVASQDPNHHATVSDFEAATGGRMTLQADPNPAQAQ